MDKSIYNLNVSRVPTSISVVAVDFDGTCVDHRYPKSIEECPDVPYAVETLKHMVDTKGIKIILYTMRSGLMLEEAVEWFKRNDIQLYGVQENPTQKQWTRSPKCLADLYIDDAAFGAPLIKISTFWRPCLDWSKVMEFFK